jgi:transcriptional regulator with XRE-family HTH domain
MKDVSLANSLRMRLSAIVGPNLKAARIRTKLSQEQLAAKAELSVSYISMLERGERTPPLETLETLARALAISPVALLESRPPARRRR